MLDLTRLESLFSSINSRLLLEGSFLENESEIPLTGSVLDHILETRFELVNDLVAECFEAALLIDAKNLFGVPKQTLENLETCLGVLCLFAESLPEKTWTDDWIYQLQQLLKYPNVATRCMILLSSWAGKQSQDVQRLSQVWHTTEKTWETLNSQWSNRALGQFALARFQYYAFGCLCSELGALGTFVVPLQPLHVMWPATGDALLSWLLPSVSHFIASLDAIVVPVVLERWLLSEIGDPAGQWPTLPASHRLLMAIAHGFFSRFTESPESIAQVPLFWQFLRSKHTLIYYKEQTLLILMYVSAILVALSNLGGTPKWILKAAKALVLHFSERVLLFISFNPETQLQIRASYFLVLTLSELDGFAEESMGSFPKLNRLIRVFYWTLFSGPDGLCLSADVFSVLDSLTSLDAAKRLATVQDIERSWTREYVLAEWAGKQSQKVKSGPRLFFLSFLGRVTHCLTVLISYNSLDAASLLNMVTLVDEFSVSLTSKWRTVRLLNPDPADPVAPSIISSTLRLTNLLGAFAKVSLFTVIAVFQALLPAARISKSDSFKNSGKEALFAYLQMLQTLQRMHFIALSFGEEGFDAWQRVVQYTFEPFVRLDAGRRPTSSGAEMLVFRLLPSNERATDNNSRCEMLFWVILVKFLVQHLKEQTLASLVIPKTETFIFRATNVGPDRRSNVEKVELFAESLAVLSSVFEKTFLYPQLCCDYAPVFCQKALANYPHQFDLPTLLKSYSTVVRGCSFYEYYNVAAFNPAALNMSQPYVLDNVSAGSFNTAAAQCVCLLFEAVCMRVTSSDTDSADELDKHRFHRGQLLKVLFAQLNSVSNAILPRLLAALDDLLFNGHVDLQQLNSPFTATVVPPLGLCDDPDKSQLWPDLYEAVSNPSRGFEYYRKQHVINWYLSAYRRAKLNYIRQVKLPSKL